MFSAWHRSTTALSVPVLVLCRESNDVDTPAGRFDTVGDSLNVTSAIGSRMFDFAAACAALHVGQLQTRRIAFG